MPNLGTAPIQPETPIGIVRGLVGDISYEVTETEGVGDYAYFSDSQITSFLAAATGNTTLAAGHALRQLAIYYSTQAVSVTSADMRVDLTKRAEQIAKLAADFISQGQTDVADAGYFTIIPGRPILY